MNVCQYITSVIFCCLCVLPYSHAQQNKDLLLSLDDARFDGSNYYMKIPFQDSLTESPQWHSISYYKNNNINAIQPIKSNDTSIFYYYGIERKKQVLVLKIPALHKDSLGQLKLIKQGKIILKYKENKRESNIVSSTTKTMKTTLSSSVLANGIWQKIAVSQAGVYKIDYNFVKNTLGQTGSIRCDMIRLFGNGGTMLYEPNSVKRPDDLTENAIQIFDDGDGIFNNNDYFLFYANGPTEWVKDSTNQQFHHRSNLYADSSYYFINFNLSTGKRITSTPVLTLIPNRFVNSFNYYGLHEVDVLNLGKFGKEWWGETFGFVGDLKNNQTFSFNTGAISDTIHYQYQLANAAIGIYNTAEFKVSLNGNLLQTHSGLYGIDGSPDNNPAVVVNGSGTVVMPSSGTLNFNIDYQKNVANAKAYLNFIEFNTRKNLQITSGQQLLFRDWQSVGAGIVSQFQIASSSDQTSVWDITNPLEPKGIIGSVISGNYVFKTKTDKLQEFACFSTNFLTPTYVGLIQNQNLHGLPQSDYLIVYHPEMKAAAEKLASFHRENSHLSVNTADVGQIYNEFASGAKDISAIRDFIKMFYDRAGSNTSLMPQYVLLLGQASYDYKNKIPGTPKIVPTFETAESIDANWGYCSDDFFTILDSTEDINIGLPLMDVTIGRIPATNAAQANALVDKIIRYKSPQSLGSWRLNNIYIGDNEDNAGNHLLDADSMCKIVNYKTPIYKAQKVYLDNMNIISTPGGYRCPDANKIINDNIKKGSFLLNYSGHGSIYTLAHERIVTQDDFNSWNNQYKLPFLITATCDFGRFDNPELQSSGEKVLLKTDGGAIALITTTQVVYASYNIMLNSAYLKSQFDKKNSGGWYSFGDAFLTAKNSAPSENTRKFALLGDPALIPNFPRYDIQTDSIRTINHNNILSSDTIKSLGSYKVYASVRVDNGAVIANFNGKAQINFYDKSQNVKTKTANSGSSDRNYTTQNNAIFTGMSNVNNGVFTFEFIAPKDINYDFGKGKILYYANNETIDAAGADTNIVVGGFEANPAIDNDAPIVNVYMNDSLFKNGGLTGTNSAVFTIIKDNSGINVTGNFPGHDLVAILDGNEAMPFVMNDYYETALNTYKLGYINYPLYGLSDGIHQIKVKAWDVYNNSGEGYINFEVLNGKTIKISKIYNYPNPFNEYTNFSFEHNHPNEPLKAEITIFNTMGGLVKIIEQTFTSTSGNTAEIKWDGTGISGEKLAPGIYPYRIRLTTEKNIKDLGYQKLILTR